MFYVYDVLGFCTNFVHAANNVDLLGPIHTKGLGFSKKKKKKKYYERGAFIVMMWNYG